MHNPYLFLRIYIPPQITYCTSCEITLPLCYTLFLRQCWFSFPSLPSPPFSCLLPSILNYPSPPTPTFYHLFSLRYLSPSSSNGDLIQPFTLNHPTPLGQETQHVFPQCKYQHLKSFAHTAPAPGRWGSVVLLTSQAISRYRASYFLRYWVHWLENQGVRQIPSTSSLRSLKQLWVCTQLPYSVDPFS